MRAARGGSWRCVPVSTLSLPRCYTAGPNGKPFVEGLIRILLGGLCALELPTVAMQPQATAVRACGLLPRQQVKKRLAPGSFPIP